ncbi:phosphotransferase family protein [Sphingomonas floccifaciens]|uniref:Phosphotransferase family protein n=1 Tax=Sphingomonas floccifaciens TaxID=1844115 RepID=A0ABW4NHQ3_9SPHN
MILTDPAAMHRAVFAAFPDLAEMPITVHDGGWDSVAIELGPWICKFPRDEDGFDALRREAAVLDIVRSGLTIPVPDMVVIDGPPFFTRHRMLLGGALTTQAYAALSAERRAALAQDVARFLAELHAIDADWSAVGVEAEDEDDDVDLGEGLALLPSELRATAERMIADHVALGADPLGEGFCYLDAHGRNFAFDAQAGRLAGVYDFGDVAIAGRHEEFIEPAYVSRDLARDVIAAYEAQTGQVVDRTRVETLIGMQRLTELADNADHPAHGATVRDYAVDWFAQPTLA